MFVETVEDLFVIGHPWSWSRLGRLVGCGLGSSGRFTLDPTLTITLFSRFWKTSLWRVQLPCYGFRFGRDWKHEISVYLVLDLDDKDAVLDGSRRTRSFPTDGRVSVSAKTFLVSALEIRHEFRSSAVASLSATDGFQLHPRNDCKTRRNLRTILLNAVLLAGSRVRCQCLRNRFIQTREE